MKWPEELILIRHAETTYNASKKIKEANELYKRFVEAYEEDWLSPRTKHFAVRVWKELGDRVASHQTPLNEKAEHQAYTTARKLREIMDPPDIIYCSPYQRTHDTLELIKKEWPEIRNIKPIYDERIREQDMGLLTVYNEKKVFFVHHPEQRLLYDQEGPYYYRYPQGENIPDVRLRVSSWVTTLIREFAGKRVLSMNHHLTILATRAHLERLSPQQFLELDQNPHSKPVNCGVTTYRGFPKEGKDGRLRLVQYNQKLYE